MRRLASLLLVGAALLVACNGDNGNTDTDGKVQQDMSTADLAQIPKEIVCSGDCQDFVMNKITLPDASTATQIGWDYNNDGTKDNALGSILGGLSQFGDLNIQKSVDEGVNEGGTIVLLRVQAKDFVNEAAGKAQAWVGDSTECCKDPDDPVACAAEAKTTCFGGSYTFYPHKDSPKDALFGGNITSGKMHFGPSKLRLSLPFTGAGTLELDLKAVHLTGRMAADGKSITKGILAGAVSKEDLKNKLLPTVKDMLEKTYTDKDTDPKVKTLLGNLFDNDKDGHITQSEVEVNPIIKTALDGDVDVDGDKVKEMSLGVAFEAVAGIVDDKGSQPDGGTPDMGPDKGTVDGGDDGGTAPDMAKVD